MGIVLTKRSNGAASEVALAGFPHHSLDNYLTKLVRAGQRVAICEQIEDPALAKGLVEREVTELVTPGVAFSDKLLDHRANNYLAVVTFSDGSAGAAFVDVSTENFRLLKGNWQPLRSCFKVFNLRGLSLKVKVVSIRRYWR